MNPEKLLDAMQYLPDEMLEQTDRLRRKKPLQWHRWAALAACLCLVLGFAWGLIQPGAKSENDAAAPEHALGDVEEDGVITSQSGSTSGLSATVVTVAEDRLTVTLADGTQAVVLLTELDTVPDLAPGHRIRLYLKDIAFTDSYALTPYKIELEEDLP